MNKGTKEQRNEETKERRNEGTNEGTNKCRCEVEHVITRQCHVITHFMHDPFALRCPQSSRALLDLHVLCPNNV